MGFGKLTNDSQYSDEPEVVAEINITPLTDVFLVLLIIFMVTASSLQSSGVGVNLPKTSSGGASDSRPKGVVVSLLPSGEIYLNGQKSIRYSLEDTKKLQDALLVSIEKTSEKILVLEGDQKAALGAAVKIMDLAKKAGIQNFSIATETSGNGETKAKDESN